jgi:DNA segregation ATPase FtsK/SpoIIIE, S-DNA-T family
LDNQTIVYPDELSPVAVFDRLVEEMESRYRAFHAAGVDHLGELRRKGERLPRVVCVCEEYPDLLFHGRKEIEERIGRLGQKARAGRHSPGAGGSATKPGDRQGSFASQYPSPCRTAGDQPDRVEMLLDRRGAEDLLGNGDLLFKDIGEPLRLQHLYLPPDERRAIFSAS